jgi:hypothetical protein
LGWLSDCCGDGFGGWFDAPGMRRSYGRRGREANREQGVWGGACGEGRVRGVRAFDATGAVSAEHGAAVDPTEGFNLPIGTTML